MAETQVIVTIENLAPENGTFLTPFWVGFHDGNFDTYDQGVPASSALERLAEDGNTQPLSEDFLNSGNGSVDGTIAGLAGLEGPIDPGEVVTATFTLDSADPTSRYFSYASMIVPSNDAFIANGDPLVREIFDADGNFLGAEFTVPGSAVLDAGTEVNDELVENTAFFSQAAPDTGVEENGVVAFHPGFIPGGRILSEDGSSEGAPAAFTSADFTAEGYQVARITIEEVPLPVAITSDLDGPQEVDGGDPDALGNSTLTLNTSGDSLEYSLTVTGLDFGANGLIEGGAQTEDTSDDVTRIHIHNGVRGENGPVAFSLFDTVAPELGNELNIQGNQDEDLVVTLNDDGSVTLTGAWEETDPANAALSEFVDEIRAAQAEEDLPLYWNVHTEEFPGGAIRGQLVVEEAELLDTPFFRFQNSSIPGTYVYATGEEADNIRDNLTGFVEEGLAFNAAIEPNEDLIPLFRLENTQLPGTFLYVGEEELSSIEDDPNFSDIFNNQGIAFYVYGVGANQETPFTRFQNSTVPGTYLYATGEEAATILSDFTNFIEEGTAFEARI